MLAKATGPKSLTWQLAVLGLFTFVILFVLGYQDESYLRRAIDLSSAEEHSTSSLNPSVAQHLTLTSPISYAQVHIDVKSPERNLAADHGSENKELGIPRPTPHRVCTSNSTECANAPETPASHTTLYMKAPREKPVDASSVVFGVATTLDRLKDSLLPFSHWAGHTGAKIVALVDDTSISAGQIAEVTRDAADLGIHLDVARQGLGNDATHGDRSFALVKHLYERRPETRSPAWAAFIDDDTFFPSIEALVGRLAQCDASKPQYIGGLTEDLRQLQFFGYMAYGGGGIFLSMPLLSQVYEHFDECNARRVEGGDKRLAECIYEHTATKLTWEPGLRQADMHGDASGFYEADRGLPLSIHHWKSWALVDVVGLSAVSKICGTECLLRRYRFTDGWFLANGFSIFKYSDEYEIDDRAMEETWSDGGDYHHTLSPLRPKDEGKISYRLERSIVETDTVRQYYVRRRDEGDGIVEVIWRRRP